MKTILQYVAIILVPSVFLICLGFMVLNRSPDQDVLKLVAAMPWLLLPISWFMPRQQGLWLWLATVPLVVMVACGGWFYFRLTPPDEYPSDLLWIGFWASIFGGGRIVDFIHKKWWPRLPMVLKVVLVTTGIIVATGVALYLLSIMLRDTDWYDVLITNWYLTLLVLYLPVFLGVLIVRSALEKRKTERQPDA